MKQNQSELTIFKIRATFGWECQNIPVGYKNVPEYLECTENAVRIFLMQFDYQRIYNRNLAHSGTSVMGI